MLPKRREIGKIRVVRIDQEGGKVNRGCSIAAFMHPSGPLSPA
jgi:hypothetical protein